MIMRSTLSLHIRIFQRFLALLVLAGVAMTSVPGHSGEADDYLKKITEKCNELTQKQNELDRQAAQRGQSASPEVAASLERLKALANSAQQLIAEGPPQDPSKKEEYVRNLSMIAGESALVTRSAQRSMGIGSMGALDRWLDADPHDLKTKFGRFDGAKPSNATERDINIPRTRDSDFFGAPRPQAPGAAAVPVTGAVLKTTEADARKITDRDGHWGGGVMLEGTATAVGRNSRVRYNTEFNALVVDDRSIYLLSIAPWTVAVLCRAIAADDNGLVGVSLTGEERLFFGKGKSVYQDSDLGHDLTLADRFLGDIVLGSGKWTIGYNYFDGFTPEQASEATGRLAVRFAFTGFEFRTEAGEILANPGRLEIRFAPLSDGVAEGGGLVPDYKALAEGFEPPVAYASNARHVAEHLDYYGQERIVRRMFQYGEVAAFLRGLKQSNVDLVALAQEITLVR
jgi:hypothetical protein